MVYTAHGWSFADGVAQPGRAVYKFLERRFAPMADAIITVCQADREYALVNSVGRSDQLIAVNNGIVYMPLKTTTQKVDLAPKIVMVARFEQPKDHLMLVSSLSGIKDIDWSLDLVGDGPLLDSVRNRVFQLGIQDRVNFLGRRSDVAAILEKSDVFVLTSFWEGFPLSIIEAMRASIPTIASNVGGVAEAIDEGVTGFLIDVGDVSALQIYLRELILDPEKRRALGENARLKYEDSFTFEIMAKKTLEVYEAVLLGNKRY